MRIISGKWKGRRLVPFSGPHIRPTTDRVKETWFNIWQLDIQESHVLDLFSGTGSLSFEALSRGASHVTAVEMSRQSAQIIHKNRETLKAEDLTVCIKDVFKYLKDYNGQPYDLIFVDPPFTQMWADRVMSELSQSTVWSANTKIGIEATSRETLQNEYGSIQRVDTRDFGDKLLALFQPK